MNYESTIILIGILGVVVSVLGVILIGFIVYYYYKTKDEREHLLSRIPEEFYRQLEKNVGPKIDLNISEVNKKIQKATDEIIESYKKQMIEAPQELKNKIDKFSGTCTEAQSMILKEAEIKIGQISEAFTKKVNSIYLISEKTINQNIIATEKIIEEHKKEKLKELDKKIYQMIGEVAKKTLGETIDFSTHEKLVREALEKAKEENIF